MKNKLYTEEDVLQMLRSFHTYEINVQLCMLKLKPIKIPSDDEIENLDTFLISDVDSFIRGAKWMRDKIQGGNK
jgi:hypothetical protein